MSKKKRTEWRAAKYMKEHQAAADEAIGELEQELEEYLSGEQGKPQRLFAQCAGVMQRAEEQLFNIWTTRDEGNRLQALFNKAREAAARYCWQVWRELYEESCGYDVGEYGPRQAQTWIG